MSAPTTPELRRGLLVLGAVAAGAAALVALTWQAAAPRIDANVAVRAEAAIAAVLGSVAFDNRLSATAQAPDSPAARQAGVEQTWVARQGTTPVALVLQISTADGYSGRIVLLVGLTPAGEVLGVETLAHRETPGLGDFIETTRSDWLRQFHGRRLGAPPVEAWRVQRDGGTFDAVTGATVTARAVTGALRRALVYFHTEGKALLQPADPQTAEPSLPMPGP